MNDKSFTPRKPRPVASSRPVRYFCYGRACGLRKSTAIKAAICILKKNYPHWVNGFSFVWNQADKTSRLKIKNKKANSLTQHCLHTCLHQQCVLSVSLLCYCHWPQMYHFQTGVIKKMDLLLSFRNDGYPVFLQNKLYGRVHCVVLFSIH